MKKFIMILILSMLVSSHAFSAYILTDDDNKIIIKIDSKIKKAIQQKGVDYGNNLISQMNKVKRKTKFGSRAYTIINTITLHASKSNIDSFSTTHYKEFNIDIYSVKKYWLELHNNVRKTYKIQTLGFDNRIDSTAFEWSSVMNKNGKMSHERNPNDGWYNYPIIEQWFQDRGVKCKASNHVTSSESIATFGYYCPDSKDCTEKLKSSLKDIFDMYMSEKNLGYPNDAHYRAITHPSFSKIGLGIYISNAPIDENGWGGKNYYNYYISTHYCTEFE